MRLTKMMSPMNPGAPLSFAGMLRHTHTHTAGGCFLRLSRCDKACSKRDSHLHEVKQSLRSTFHQEQGQRTRGGNFTTAVSCENERSSFFKALVWDRQPLEERSGRKAAEKKGEEQRQQGGEGKAEHRLLSFTFKCDTELTEGLLGQHHGEVR